MELAYAQHLIATVSERLRFSALDALGRLRVLDSPAALTFLHDVAQYWQDGIGDLREDRRMRLRALSLRAVLLLAPGKSLHRCVARSDRRWIYVIPSQWVLERTALIESLKRSGDVKLVYFMHDVLPLTHPEYFLPNVEERDRRRADNAMRFADAIVVNSNATANALRALFGPALSDERIVVALLGPGVRPCVQAQQPPSRSPYFVMLGTIEPRKNHLLMLNVWRAMRAERGPATPRLVLIGHRGWKNTPVFNMLDRDSDVRGVVEECGRLSDSDAAGLLAGARALVLPSFAEGYGLPLTEALAAGVPVICSDIPVFREIGGNVPEYLNPTDASGWRTALIAYTDADSPSRHAQLTRMSAWEPPSWDAHFTRFTAILSGLGG